MTHPTGPTLLQGRPYRDSASTDVRETWKLHGWQAPSTQPGYAPRIHPLPPANFTRIGTCGRR